MDIKRNVIYEFHLSQKEVDELYEALRKMENYDYITDPVMEIKNKLSNFAE